MEKGNKNTQVSKSVFSLEDLYWKEINRIIKEDSSKNSYNNDFDDNVDLSTENELEREKKISDFFIMSWKNKYENTEK